MADLLLNDTDIVLIGIMSIAQDTEIVEKQILIKTARALALTNGFLLDIHLPKIDGLEILRRIRSDRRTKEIPVVVLTSSRLDRDRIESYQLGVNSYIVKPIEFDNFTRTVAQIGLYWAVLNKPPY